MKYLQILSGLLTPLIAIITTYIAIQQYRSNRAKLRHDLYEKRFKVYKVTSEYLSAPNYIGSKNLEHWKTFHRAIDESPFLFDAELVSWLMEIKKTGQRLNRLNALIQANLDQSEQKIHQHQEYRVWVGEQEKLVVTKFMQYLDLKNLK